MSAAQIRLFFPARACMGLRWRLMVASVERRDGATPATS